MQLIVILHLYHGKEQLSPFKLNIIANSSGIKMIYQIFGKVFGHTIKFLLIL